MGTKITIVFIICIVSFGKAQIWNPVSSGYSNPVYQYKIEAPNENTAWLVGVEVDDSTGITTDINHELRITKDGGQNWNTVLFPHNEPGYIANISALNNNTAYLSYNDYGLGPQIFKTNNGGIDWEEKSAEISVWINVVHCFNNIYCVAMGDPDDDGFEISTSINSGDNWFKVSQDNIPPHLEGEYGFTDAYRTSGNKMWFWTSMNRIFYTENRGFSWSLLNTPDDGELFNLFVGHDDALFAVYMIYNDDFTNPEHTLYVSYNNGTSWTDITSNDNKWWIRSIEKVPGTSTYISQFNEGGDIQDSISTRISYDDCKSFIVIDSTTTIGNLTFLSPTRGYATDYQDSRDTSTSKVYLYAGSPLTGLFYPDKINADISLFPNPATNKIKLYVESPSIDDFIILINDVNGRLVEKHSVNDVSIIEKEFDISKYVSGNYILTLSSKEGMKKMNFIKH